MYSATCGNVTPIPQQLGDGGGEREGREGPLSTLQGLHWRHGDIRAVLGRLGGGWRLRRLVGFVADLRVGRVVFCRLVEEKEKGEGVSWKPPQWHRNLTPTVIVIIKWGFA